MSVGVDRSTLETASNTSDEFVEAFCDKLEVLFPHSFIATQQYQIYPETWGGIGYG